MTHQPTHAITTTIGRDWFEEQTESIVDAVQSQVGQAQHYISLCRTRDAQLHLRLVMDILELRMRRLAAEMFDR